MEKENLFVGDFVTIWVNCCQANKDIKKYVLRYNAVMCKWFYKQKIQSTKCTVQSRECNFISSS